ncbi:formate/nitrite transporter family protein [Dongia sedimenti]|uniref:Formate/nitrite transporter family protein n=1 Tax=Dongia sedimenti TaxID=3064282 RepID=A0ABU0YF95_9PROT|nr:formate/nitrite transporter family protein [Rhodospirillaceae bacterium R-7]
MPRSRPARTPAKRREAEDREIDAIEHQSSPATPIIYEIVRRMGDEEMARPAISLWWSGIAAGMSISFSLLAQSILLTHLPEAAWRHLAVSLGYTVGFLMVVLSRQQLFTENTLTAVLPVMAEFTRGKLAQLARLWGIVLLANLFGTLIAAAFCTFTPVLTPELREGMMDISREITRHGWAATFFHAISAGFLMAAMVWLMPGATYAQFHVIVVITFLIAAGGFVHIVAGSMEAFMLLLGGEIGLPFLLGEFFLPVVLGNIVGGTALFGLLAYAQVMKEI